MGVNRRGRRIIPGPNYGGLEIVILEGGPDYLMPMGDHPGVGTPTPWRQTPDHQSRTPLVPTEDDVATLPRLARAAFAERCALRVRPVRPAGVATAAEAARAIFETATIDAPLTAQLRCIRRDFARLKKLAGKHNWTDDTPVPPDAFGPMWPEGVEPYWAAEPTPAPPTS